MGQQSAAYLYATRSKISHRPKFMSAEPGFFMCRKCGNLVIKKTPREMAGKGKENGDTLMTCCGQTMDALVANAGGASGEEHTPVYTIRGGFANNIIEVKIGRTEHPMTEEHHIEWVYLYTFQGGQLKYLRTTQEPKVTFAMAEEDAFVYCDRPVCKMGWDHCMFQCKRHLSIYAYCNQHGLWQLRM